MTSQALMFALEGQWKGVGAGHLPIQIEAQCEGKR
jgi:hypothetical protein